MVLTLLLSGYIGPSSVNIDLLVGILASSVLAGLLVLWWGVRLIKREKWIGFALVLVAIALPVAGWNLLGSIF